MEILDGYMLIAVLEKMLHVLEQIRDELKNQKDDGR